MESENQQSYPFLSVYVPQILAEDRGHKVFLGNREEKQCRFCGRGYPDVTFKKMAHVMPQLLGRNDIVSFFECDSCNGGIFNHYETSLAAYIGVLRTFAEIKGQNGVPKYKDSKTNFRIEFMDGMPTILARNNEAKFSVEGNQATVKTIKESYYPIRVYKSLAKIAYCLLNQKELGGFTIIHKLLMSDQYDEQFRGIPFIRLFWYFIAGEVNFKKPSAMLFKRHPELDHPFFPEKTLIVKFANLVYQIFILSDIDIELAKLSQSFTCIPFPISIEHIAGQTDLSTLDKKIGEELSYTFSFKSMKRIK